MPLIGILLNLLNLKKLIPAIIKNWKIILIVGLGFIVWYQNFNETRFLFGAETMPSLEKQLVAAVKAVDVCKKGNVTLTKAIDDRNEEVAKWKAISKSLEDDIGALQEDLNAERVKTEAEVEAILKDTTPKTCNEAIDYLRDGRKDLQWKK